jgi:hypothetical protein
MHISCDFFEDAGSFIVGAFRFFSYFKSLFHYESFALRLDFILLTDQYERLILFSVTRKGENLIDKKSFYRLAFWRFGL